MKRAIIIALLHLVLVASAALRAQGAGGAHAIDPAETETGFVHLELPGVFARDVTVRFVGGDTLLVPFTTLANALGIINHLSTDHDTISGEMPLGQPFAILLPNGTTRRRGVEDTLPARSTVTADGEVYVEVRALARVMGVQMSFDLSELTLGIVPDGRIPAVERARNRHLYASLGKGEDSASEPSTTLRRELIGSAAIRWGLVSTLQNGASNSSGVVQLAGPFLFGVLNASGTGAYRSMERTGPTGAWSTINWQIQFPEFSPLRLASVTASHAGENTSLMLNLGNAPLGGRRSFGSCALDGHTQPGWDVELYQDQKLVEVTQADQHGAYHFEVPVGYGTTTRTIHQVGPHGERIVEERTLRLNPALLPPGELQYNAALASESIKLDRSVRGDANMAVGVTNWMTLGAAFSTQAGSIGSLRPDSVNALALANFWIGDATPLGLFYNPRSQAMGGSITYTFSDRFSVQAGVDSFNLRHRDAIVANGGFHLGLGWISLGNTAQLLLNDRITSLIFSPQISFYTAGIGLNASSRIGWLKSRGELGNEPSTLAATSSLQLTAAPINGIFMMARATYDHTAHILSDLDISTSVSLASALSLSLSYTTQRLDWKGGTVYAQLSYNIGAARISVGGTYQRGEFATASTMEGGMVISRGGVMGTSYEAINQAGVIFNAFRDDNLNGVHDAGEETLNDASADLFGSAGLQHTDNGSFLSLSPYQQATITIPHERFAARGLYPRRSEFRVYTLPGATTVIDLPYAEGFDVSGHCRVLLPKSGNREASTAILTSLKVRLLATDGSAEYDGEIFDDGTIMIEGVSEGHYRIVFDEEQLSSRTIRADGAPQTVYLSRSGPVLPVIAFVPREEK